MKTKTGNFYLETGEMQLTLGRTVRKGILLSSTERKKIWMKNGNINHASIVLNELQIRELISELQNMIV